MNSRAGTVLAIAVGVLVLLAVVAGVFSATRDSPDLPAGSPEAIVQDYVAHVYDRDFDAALELLEPATSCTFEDLSTSYAEPGARVVLRDTRVDGDRATVQLDFVRGSDGPFQSEWTSEETFVLTRSDQAGQWAIADSPWPMFVCGRHQ